MKKHFTLLSITILMLILTSCTGNTSTSTPISNEDAVATAVATMLSGIPTNTPLPEPTVTLTPESQTLLPRSLYFLAQDSNGIGQIFRLSRDGNALTQITFEQDWILNFDISPIDGTLAYPTQNSLITVDANGTNRQVVAQDPNIRFSIAWSPDGKTIAYGDRDMFLYSLATGSSETLIASSDDANILPQVFSPDGTKLIIRKFNSKYIYNLASSELIPISDARCSSAQLVWDSSSFIFCYGEAFAAGSKGLWRVNAIDGSTEPLIFTDSCPPCSPVTAPRQDNDGNLYYFYGEVLDISNVIHPSLSFMRSAPDGITSRVAIRSELFNIASVLWTPDGNAVLIVQTDMSNDYPKSVVLVPVDSSLPIVSVLADASGLTRPYTFRWGP